MTKSGSSPVSVVSKPFHASSFIKFLPCSCTHTKVTLSYFARALGSGNSLLSVKVVSKASCMGSAIIPLWVLQCYLYTSGYSKVHNLRLQRIRGWQNPRTAETNFLLMHSGLYSPFWHSFYALTTSIFHSIASKSFYHWFQEGGVVKQHSYKVFVDQHSDSN